MGDDMLNHFASNSSNQSDQSLPTKIAKLEARMVGKGPAVPSPSLRSAPLNPAPASKLSFSEDLPASVSSSDSDDDDNGAAYLIQANILKRQRLNDTASSTVFDHFEVVGDGKSNSSRTLEIKTNVDMNKIKHGRGRGQSTSSRGRGLKSDKIKTENSQSVFQSLNGHRDNTDNLFPEQAYDDDQSALLVELASLRAKLTASEEELHKSRQDAKEHELTSKRLEKELKELRDHEQLMKPKRLKVFSDLLISVSKAERQEARMKVRQDSLRLGNVGVMRTGTIISETWEDGQALKDLNMQLKHLIETKESVERQRKALKKRHADKGDGGDGDAGTQEEEFLFQDEIYKTRLATIKREEETLLRERDRYELEKGRLIREMKRIRDEDGSRFNNFQILNHRYALLNLLGKGGFSEVYKAFDLVEHRFVACKLHGLNAQWSEEKKQSYIRHAIREYNIHKTLVHHHIVRLWDIFEIDQNTFCTVLEYCNGKDLDAVLKAAPLLPEKEARIIIVQIFQGLVYLNKRTQKIIHYDLKPGNVLFDDLGVAKVTDFGLSKIVEDDVGSQGMELTSQGAGTYWYLPPECFELSKTPLISSKVDVWSAGVLFYQMLFGRRPFGHDQTQERILREDTIIKARKVEFPSRPGVSNEAKELIRQCLTYNQADRPDVLTIAQDPYLTYSKK
uniref:Protein kinase domain-containing protein n=1 Tax=Kalanchoe fedtschenkoi TaxID=63787 RepID=A0A7N0U8K2_KALFE